MGIIHIRNTIFLKEFIKSEVKSPKFSAARASNPYQKKAYEKVLIRIPPPSKIFPVLKGGILIKGGILNINYPDHNTIEFDTFFALGLIRSL